MSAGVDVLIADDEESLRDILTEVLIDDGHRVVTAEDGDKAIEIFQRQSFPLVITDIRMPGRNGIQLLEDIKAINSEAEVIIMTSHASFETALKAMANGAYDYLIKPFESLNMISTVVNRAVDNIRLKEERRKLEERLKINNEQLQKANQELKELSSRDGLTNLFNHRHIMELLEAEVRRSKRYSRVFSLIFLDVDHFKKYNDTHGHSAGDDLLCALGKILAARLRASDMAGRYGGEEFVLILPETNKTGAVHVAADICRQVARCPFPGRESQPGGAVTVSVGVASYPEDGADAAAVIHRADEAMYSAKHGGRNRVCVSGRT